MATKTIDQLNSASTLTGTEVLPIVQGNQTVKTPVQDVADLGGKYLVSNNPNIDWSLSSTQEVNITDDTEFTFSGAKEGQKLTLILNAGQSFELTFPDSVIWNKSDVFDYDIQFIVDENFKLPPTPIDNFLLQSTDKIIIDYNIFNENTNTQNYIISRLNSNGTVDNTFNEYVDETGETYAGGIQSDNKILLNTSYIDLSTLNNTWVIKRLNSNGTIDEDFSDFEVPAELDKEINVYIQNIVKDDKILISTYVEDFINETITETLSRLNANGTVDNDFNEYTLSGDYSLYEEIRNVYIQSDDKILIAKSQYDNTGQPIQNLIRLNSDGTVDNTFNILPLQPEEYINSIVETDNGDIVIVGSFQILNQDGQLSNGIFKLNNDGTPGINGYGFWIDFNRTFVQSILKDSNGKLIIFGEFNQYGPQQSPISYGIIRLNDDLSIDDTFNAGNGFSDDYFNGPSLDSNDDIIGLNNNINQNFNGQPLLNESLNKIIETKGYRIINFYYNGSNYIGTFS
jgi:uncharacterized delta-60 repeat protein